MFIFLGITALLLIGAISSEKKDNLPSNEGKIKFSHSLHKDLVDCQTCHSAVMESINLKSRLFPTHDNCSDCHEVDNDEECSTCHYDDNFEALTKRESGLLFNHKFHLTDQKIDCESCHKGISDVDYSWQAVQPNPPMEQCYSCHNNKTVASNACESCHISTVNLIPQNHKVISFT
ncbi:MAG TPA: cytochrome c3 family protein, partial [Ignavibacteriaceae bacterium]|nr:cytochrome c3 family protein [Ignavibacteriaceae bacterium]